MERQEKGREKELPSGEKKAQTPGELWFIELRAVSMSYCHASHFA